jgi:predicted MFS family arabinose efflux permease
MSQTAGRSGSVLRSLLARAEFRKLLGGQVTSGIGDWMATVALMALVLQISGSSTAVGAILVLRLAPASITGPVAPRVVSRWDRRRAMLSMDAVRVVIVALIPLVFTLWWVYLWAFLLEVAGLIFLPARDAIIPDLVEEEHLPLANGLILACSYGTMPLGAGAYALISGLLGHRSGLATWIVFAVDAITFVVSLAMIRQLHDNRREHRREEPGEPSTSFREAWRLDEVRAIALPTAAVALGLDALFSLGIVFVRKVLGASSAEFSLLIALFGVGAAIGLVILRVFRGRAPRLVRAAVLAQGVTVTGMALSPSIGWAFLGALCFGGATAIAMTGTMSELQRSLDDQQRVMAFTVFHVLVRGGLATAAIGAGLATDLLGHRVTWPVAVASARLVFVVSGIVVLVGAAFTRGARRQFRLG